MALVDDKELCYHFLGDFDKAMLSTLKSERNIQKLPVVEIWHNDGDQILAFQTWRSLIRLQLLPYHLLYGLWFHGEKRSILCGT